MTSCVRGRDRLLPASLPQAAGTSPASAAVAAAACRRLWSSDVGQLHDKILLRGLVFHGYHGVLPEVCAVRWGRDAALALPLLPPPPA